MYRQGEIVTVRELVVTDGLEVDCLQIEHELHCHEPGTGSHISFFAKKMHKNTNAEGTYSPLPVEIQSEIQIVLSHCSVV